jgi:HK97 family phage major capsid protein
MATAMSIEELEQRQNEIEGLLKQIDQEFAGQIIPEEERGTWNELCEERDANDALLDELRARMRTIEKFAANPDNLERGTEFNDLAFHTARPGAVRGDDIYDTSTIRADLFSSPEKMRDESVDRAQRAIETAVIPILDSKKASNVCDEARAKSHMERLIHHTREATPGETARHFLITGSPIYKRAFGKAMTSVMRGGHPHMSLSPDEQRALGLGALTGGQAVPFTLDPTVIPTSNSVVNPARALARVESITGSNTWNGISSGAITASRAAEIAVASDNSPTMAAPTVTVTKAQAFVPFSVEIQEDWAGMETEMAQLFQDAKDDEEGAAFVTGVGTTVFPQGFTVGTTNTSAAATGLTVTAANVYALEAALPPRFRPNASFVANRAIYNVIRGIDTAGGAALWLYISQGLVTQTPTPGNTGATLLGRGAWEASAMQATVVNATKIMVIGDFNYFLIVDRIGLHVELIPFLFGASQGNLPVGQRGIYAWWRNSSKVLSANAFVAMTGTT